MSAAGIRKAGDNEDGAPLNGAGSKRRRVSDEDPAANNGPARSSTADGKAGAGPSAGASDDSDSGDDACMQEVDAAVARLLGGGGDSDDDSSSSSSSSSSEDEKEQVAEKNVVAEKRKPAPKSKSKAKSRPAKAGGAPAAAAEPEAEAVAPPPPAQAVEEEGAAGGAAPGAAGQQQGEAPPPEQEAAGNTNPAPAPRSPASESSSSSESESESESEDAGVGPGIRRDAQSSAGADAAQEMQVVEVNQYDAVRRAILKRDELARLFSSLPQDAAQAAVVRCYVSLAVQAASTEQENAACVLAEVVGIEPSPAYVVNRSDGQRTTLKVRLNCKRGGSQRLVKISSVSNRDLTETEHEQWRKLMERTGIESRLLTDRMVEKAADINTARNFRFDEATVSKMLAKKGNLEFDAQKESRMRFLVQTAMTQMDISSIRDNEARELEQRYKDSLNQLRNQEARSTELQKQWFEKRANLFSLKMINKKNYERQVRDDRHALDYTLENEAGGKEGLNPFQRRACRPVMAWDTQLTEVEGLPANEKAAEDATAPEKDTEAKAAAPGKPADSPENGEVPINEQQRMERFVRAHIGARRILAGLSGLGTRS